MMKTHTRFKLSLQIQTLVLGIALIALPAGTAIAGMLLQKSGADLKKISGPRSCWIKPFSM